MNYQWTNIKKCSWQLLELGKKNLPSTSCQNCRLSSHWNAFRFIFLFPKKHLDGRTPVQWRSHRGARVVHGILVLHNLLLYNFSPKNEKQTTQALDGLKAEAGPTNTTLTWSVKTTLPVGLFRFQSPDRLTLGRKPWWTSIVSCNASGCKFPKLWLRSKINYTKFTVGPLQIRCARFF